jgi:hypothetical protein
MKRLFLWLLAITSAGCFGTETGNPSLALIAIDTHSSDPRSVSIRQTTGALVIDQAWITFGTIALVPEDGCPTGAGALASDVIGAGDHSEPGALSLDIALMNRASFCELVASFAPLTGAAPAGAPPELDGRALVLIGHLADGTPLRIVSAFEGDVRVAPAGGFALAADAPGLLIGLDAARWLSGVDLSDATREVDGSIVLDDTRNTALRDALDARIPEGVELYRDEGSDGVLDPVPVLIGRGSL